MSKAKDEQRGFGTFLGSISPKCSYDSWRNYVSKDGVDCWSSWACSNSNNRNYGYRHNDNEFIYFSNRQYESRGWRCILYEFLDHWG